MSSRDRQIFPEVSSKSSIFLESRNRLREAEELRQSGKLDSAQAICSKLIARYPDYAAALHSLGLILTDRGQHLDAVACLTRAAMHNPGNWSIHAALGVAYLRLGAQELAEQSLERALTLRPQGEAAIHASLGELHRDRQDYERAAEAFGRALALQPGFVTALTGLGLALVDLERPAEAVSMLEKSLAHAPSNLNALLALAELPGQFVKLDLLSRIEALPSRPTTRERDAQLAFIRAAALDQRGKHAEAWSGFLAANKIMFRDMEPLWKKRREYDLKLLDHLNASPRLPAPSHQQDDAPLPLFILGPSRSGKSTAERLVGTIKEVRRGFENRLVERSVRRSFQEAALPPLDLLSDLPGGLEPAFRARYLESLDAAARGSRLFTTTHPARMVDALRLAQLLPKAKFVLIRRDADDLTVRIFMKMFSAGHAYAYSLASIREYVRFYYAALDLIADRLPGRTCSIRYEEMIADPRAARSTLSQFCGLAASSEPIPDLGNDVGCAKHYPL